MHQQTTHILMIQMSHKLNLAKRSLSIHIIIKSIHDLLHGNHLIRLRIQHRADHNQNQNQNQNQNLKLLLLLLLLLLLSILTNKTKQNKTT
ncbi:hypothetical protein Hanom_Chr08g00755151 [Helianthus anomalus]